MVSESAVSTSTQAITDAGCDKHQPCGPFGNGVDCRCSGDTNHVHERLALASRVAAREAGRSLATPAGFTFRQVRTRSDMTATRTARQRAPTAIIGPDDPRY